MNGRFIEPQIPIEAQEGKKQAERVLAFGKSGDFDPNVAYDARIFDVLSYDSLATCYFRLGRYSQSRHHYELAAACDPSRMEYRVKGALCARLERSGSAASRKA